MSDLTQASIYDQYVQKETEKAPAVQVTEGHSKKPQNMDEMIILYMEMKTSHMVMESRISHLEQRVRTLFNLVDNQQEQIELLMSK